MQRRRNGAPDHDKEEQTISKARRRLFVDDHEEDLRRVVFDLEQLREEQKRRWNFDFENDTPLPGRYQWEATVQPPVNGRDAADDSKIDVTSPRQVRITKFLRKKKIRHRQALACAPGIKGDAKSRDKRLKRTSQPIVL